MPEPVNPSTRDHPATRAGPGMNSHGGFLHDPQALFDDTAALDRQVHEQLVETVLSWRQGDDAVPPPADLAQIALQLTSYARLLTEGVTAACAQLPSTDPAAHLGRHACGEAVRRLGARRRLGRHLAHVQSLALLVRALHRAFDRAEAAHHAAATTAP
ncbi:DUF6415 family natural product biosynthesis protein [Streptomyces sp. NPDC051219]|uniref:DUF6415 family natural product biosynthesis protein n=1 Tax=Streptomyces sp. NPDC051219 TaxID=3155283 RepID=UPI00343BE246